MVGLSQPTSKYLAANFCKQLREMARAEFSKSKDHMTKASVFTQDIHVEDGPCFFSNSKKTNNLFMDLNNYNNSFNIYVTLKIFSKHFHTYSLISSF